MAPSPDSRRSSSDGPATQAQKDYAGQLGIEFDDNISKRQISQRIDAAIEHRRKELSELDDRESEAYHKLREEVEKALDAESPRLCDVTPKQMVAEMSSRGCPAIVLQFGVDVLDVVDFETGAGDVSIEFTDDLTEDQVRKLLMFVGASLMSQQ